LHTRIIVFCGITQININYFWLFYEVQKISSWASESKVEANSDLIFVKYSKKRCENERAWEINKFIRLNITKGIKLRNGIKFMEGGAHLMVFGGIVDFSEQRTAIVATKWTTRCQINIISK
jgi:hypothetical protein